MDMIKGFNHVKTKEKTKYSSSLEEDSSDNEDFTN